MRRKYLLPFAMTGLLLGGLPGNAARPVAPLRNSGAGIGAAAAGQSAVPTSTRQPLEKAVSVESAPADSLLVSGITITAAPNGETEVIVAMTKPASFRLTVLDHPRRLVVDLDGARIGMRRTIYAANSPVMSRVRVAQFQLRPDVVRVVADLLGNPKFDVHSRPDGIRIELRARGGQTVQGSTLEKPVLMSLPPAREKLAALVAGIEPPSNIVDPPAAEAALPAGIGTTEASASLKPALSAAPESLRAQHAANIISGSGAAEDEGQAAGTVGQSPEQPKYTGEPISVNLKDVDLKDFFRLIHEISGLNIIVDPNVAGSVTMVLDDVPWDQALDIVLKNNGLGKTLEGNVLRIAKLDTLTAEQAAVTRLAAARIEAQPLVTKFIPISYAKGTTLAALLKTWAGGPSGGGALSKRGTVLVDDRTNTLIVSDIASQIPIITDVVAKLDTKTKQVSIEARVVQATAEFERDLSSALAVAGAGHTTQTVGTTGPAASSTASGQIPSAPSVTFSPPSGAGFGVWGISSAGAHYAINAVLTANELNNKAKVLSSPSIVTQDNTPGTVIQGVEVPVTTSINLTVTTQLVQASLQMTVTPHVTQDGNVFLNINVNNASLVGVSFAGPTINQQSATTQVLVPDGGTVIFGGVKTSNFFYNATYVPWLGQIPVLGHLFKSTVNHTNTGDLLFFVTPKVLPG